MKKEYQNPLDDKRVLLSVELDDIKNKARELGITLKDIDFDNVFYLHRKYMENDYVMQLYWDSLETAITESVKNFKEMYELNE